MLCIFVQTGSVALQKRCHLIDKGAGSACTDSVHTLLNVSVFKINDLCVLAAKLNRYISFRRKVFQRSRYGNYLLDKG